MTMPYETDLIEAPEMNVVAAVRMMFEDEPKNRFVIVELSTSGDWRYIVLDGDGGKRTAAYPTSLEAGIALGILQSLLREPTDVIFTAIVDLDRSCLTNARCHAAR